MAKSYALILVISAPLDVVAEEGDKTIVKASYSPMLFDEGFENMLAKRAATSMPLEIADAIRSIVDAAFSQMLKPAGWESLFLLIAGLSMILISFYAARREKKARLAASEAETQVF